MTTQLPSRERLAELAHNILSCHEVEPSVVKAMAVTLLAGMEQEPYFYVDGGAAKKLLKGHTRFATMTTEPKPGKTLPLYINPAPSIPDVREAVRQAHAEWSQATFGNVGPVGPLKHLAKEAIEAANEPGDLSEWADCQFLLWDAQRRAGITDEQIARACAEKLEVNKARSWPEPKDGEPRLHVKDDAPSIPTVPEDMTAEMMRAVQLNSELGAYAAANLSGAYNLFAEFWKVACRAAMLHSGDVTDKAEPVARSDERLMEMPTDDEILLAIEGITTGDGWIPVSERLPKKGERILIFIDFNSQSVPPSIHDAEYTGATFRRGEATVKAYPHEDGFGVTHWQPLPAAPKGV